MSPSVPRSLTPLPTPCCVLLASGLAAALSEVVPFDPEVVFSKALYGDGSDLLVLVERRRLLGRSPLDGLGALEGLGPLRRRGLVVSVCRACEHYAEVLRNWRLAEEELPVALLLPRHEDEPDRAKLRLDLAGVREPLAALKAFLGRCDAGELAPWVRSLPPPPAAEQGAVLEVVGSSFAAEVLGEGPSVLLLVYKPWCGFSRLLQPVFLELGRRLGPGNPHVRVARFDVESNDYPLELTLDTSAIPRIYLFRAGNRTRPEEYTNDPERTVSALLSWLGERLPSLAAWLEKDAAVATDSDPDPEHAAEF